MRILFVEDDPMNRRVVRDMLQLVGAEMHEAESACAGLDMIEAQPFDVVLMDLRMPGMDGMEAIGRIRGRQDHKAMLPIIVVTADTALNIRENCVQGGANEVIMKPVAMKQLFDAIGRAFIRAAAPTSQTSTAVD